MATTLKISLVILALFLLVACGGGSDDVCCGGGQIDPTGEWAITYTVTSDTCNSGFVDEILDVELTLSNDGNFVYWQDEGEPCGAFPLPWNGSGNESYTDTEDFMGGDGCSYHDDITATIMWTDDSYVGEIVYVRTIVAGINCTNHPAPCEIRESIQGGRCNGCYDGCI